MKPAAACLPALLALLCCAAQAEAVYVFVGYQCDKRHDSLVLTYQGTSAAEGEALAAQKRPNLWDPWRLVVAKDDDHIGSLITVKRQCRLSDGLYTVEITPSPGNFNVQGRCGAWMTAGVRVRRAGRQVYALDRFDRDCHDDVTPVVARVTIRPRQSPEVQTMPKDEFTQ